MGGGAWVEHEVTMFDYSRTLPNHSIIELDDGKIYRKALYLMVKTMVSCKFSLKPTQSFQIPNQSKRFWNSTTNLHLPAIVTWGQLLEDNWVLFPVPVYCWDLGDRICPTVPFWPLTEKDLSLQIWGTLKNLQLTWINIVNTHQIRGTKNFETNPRDLPAFTPNKINMEISKKQYCKNILENGKLWKVSDMWTSIYTSKSISKFKNNIKIHAYKYSMTFP